MRLLAIVWGEERRSARVRIKSLNIRRTSSGFIAQAALHKCMLPVQPLGGSGPWGGSAQHARKTGQVAALFQPAE